MVSGTTNATNVYLEVNGTTADPVECRDLRGP